MPVDPLDAKIDLNLRVGDLEASIDWYARMFGTEPIYRGVDRSVDGRVSTPMACFRLGGVKIWLLPRGDNAAPAGKDQRVGIAFMTRQKLAPLRAELSRRGAEFDDTPTPDFPIDAQGVRIGKDAEFLYILDPDGHKLEFCHTYR
ncbi:MAG: VOC family protein [Caulobacterales bacterium]